MEGISADLITVSAIIGVMVFLVLYTIFIPRPSTNFKPADDASSASMKYAGMIGTELINSLPAEFVYKKRDKTKIHGLIKRSGNPWKVTAEEFFFLQFVSAFVAFVIGWGFWFMINLVSDMPWYLIVTGLTLFGYFFPRLKYNSSAKERDTEFKRQLPEALDMMRISLSSGNDLPEAIRRTTEEIEPGVLKKEFTDLTRRYGSGMTMDNALDHFANAAPSEAVESFVKAIKQSNALNVGMTETIENRSAASRAEYMALIDKKISTLNPKMMGILTPTLMPALLITILSPVAFNLLGALGGGLF